MKGGTMPLKGGKLTPKEAQFIGHMAATGDATYSAKMAGYGSAPLLGWQKAHNPAIAESVRKAQITRLTNELLPASLDLLSQVLTDTKESTRNRITAAQTVLKYTLGANERGEEKAPEDMTPAEIQARIDQLRRAAADKARPVIEGQVQAPDPGVFD
jgi:phage terminase small subunit